MPDSIIDFGKVIRINGRRIEVKADAPSADEIARLDDRQRAKGSEIRQDSVPAVSPADSPDAPTSNAGAGPSKPPQISIDRSDLRTKLSDRPKSEGNVRDRFREIAPQRGLLVGVQVGYIDAFGGSKIGAGATDFSGRQYAHPW